MNVNNITLKPGEKYVAFATESPQTVYSRLCTLPLAFLQDLWWEYYDAWDNDALPASQKIPVWVHLQVITSIIINRYGWNDKTRTPWRERPLSTEVQTVSEVYKTLDIGSPAWKDYWVTHPAEQTAMLDWMQQKAKENIHEGNSAF